MKPVTRQKDRNQKGSEFKTLSLFDSYKLFEAGSWPFISETFAMPNSYGGFGRFA
jgi:hypothetical protein